MIEIDGASGEGGGQILRTSLALSMCTGQAFTLTNIRAKRPKPGLMRQHLACVRAAVAVSAAQAQGATLGASTLVFDPGALQPGEHHFDVGTAGSSTLVLQTVWPALLQAAAPSHLHLSGGTHNPMAPPFPFIEHCFAPLVRGLGVGAELRLVRHGFAPQGGGQMAVRLTPAQRLQPFDVVERGPLQEVRACCIWPGASRQAGEQALAPVQDLLRHVLGGHANVVLDTPEVPAGEGPGQALMVGLRHAQVNEWVTTLGGRRGVSPQGLNELREALSAYQRHDGALGEYLADQWAVPLALAVHDAQRSAAYTCTTLSLHARTNFEVIERFLPVRFTTTRWRQGWQVQVAPG